MGKSAEYQVPFRIRLFRTLMRPVFRGLFHLLSRVEISGLENIPKQGAYLIAINHVSLYEPPFVLAFWSVAPEAVSAVDIWQRRGQSLLARLYGGIPVHRGEYDRKLIERMQAALQSGRPLLIAPEGGRSHRPGMRRALPGVAYVLEKCPVPVVPVGITGATDDFLRLALRCKRPLLKMQIGKPIMLPNEPARGEARRDIRQRHADMIMQHIARLVPPEYRGVYVDDVAEL